MQDELSETQKARIVKKTYDRLNQAVSEGKEISFSYSIAEQEKIAKEIAREEAKKEWDRIGSVEKVRQELEDLKAEDNKLNEE
jgi:hypothetical protein